MRSAHTSAVFESSHEFAFFDYFRIPYVVRREGTDIGQSDSPVGVLRPLTPIGGDLRHLVWWRGSPNETEVTRAGRFEFGGRIYRDPRFNERRSAAVTATARSLSQGHSPRDAVISSEVSDA